MDQEQDDREWYASLTPEQRQRIRKTYDSPQDQDATTEPPALTDVARAADMQEARDGQRQETADWLRLKGRLGLAKELESGTDTPAPPAHRLWWERMAEVLDRLFGKRKA